MQTANVLVSLAGDTGSQVPKYGVTASEIAVLEIVHGKGSVVDIEPAGEVERSDREERSRLTSIYGRKRDGRDVSPVALLFPGAAARLFQSLSELDITEEQYKAKTRVTADDKPAVRAAKVVAPPPEPEPAPVVVKLEKPLTPAQKRAAARAAARAEKAQAAPSTPALPEQPDDNDGIGEMPDKGAFG